MTLISTSRRRSARWAAVLAVAVAALGGAAASSAEPQADGPPDTYVAYWDDIGSQAFTAAGLSPAEGHVLFAYVAIAVYDSVTSIEGGHDPFAVEADAPSDASPEAAVVGAASTILKHYLPGQGTLVDTARTASLGTIQDGAPETHGVAF